MMNEPLSMIMSSNLITVSPDESLESAISKLRGAKIHHLPVVVGDMELKGVISLRDFFRQGIMPSDYATMTVGDIMTTGIAVLEPDEKIGAAAEVFLEHLFHAVPIVQSGKLVGIVTTFDILKYEYNKEYPGERIGLK